MIVFCYILKMADDRFYTGITKNLKNRIEQHNNGSSKFTSRFLPVRLIHFEELSSYIEARKKEKWIKNFGARKYLIKKKFDAFEYKFDA